MPKIRNFGTWILDLERLVAATFGPDDDGEGLCCTVCLAADTTGHQAAVFELRGEEARRFLREVYEWKPGGPRVTLKVYEDNEDEQRRAA